MVFITADTWQKNVTEVIVLDKIKWLNETNIEEQLGYSKLRNITLQHPKHLRKQRQELLQECVKQLCRRFLREDFAIETIMDCRTTPSINFKTRLGFNQQDPVITQEQSVLTKIKTAFSTEEIIFQHSVLEYRINAYFLKRRLAIEVDEKGHQDGDFECEIERQKTIEKKLYCKFTKINPAKENFNIFNEICRIHHYIVESREKSLINKISDTLLSLKFKSNNSI